MVCSFSAVELNAAFEQRCQLVLHLYLGLTPRVFCPGMRSSAVEPLPLSIVRTWWNKEPMRKAHLRHCVAAPSSPVHRDIDVLVGIGTPMQHAQSRPLMSSLSARNTGILCFTVIAILGRELRVHQALAYHEDVSCAVMCAVCKGLDLALGGLNVPCSLCCSLCAVWCLPCAKGWSRALALLLFCVVCGVIILHMV